MSAHTPGPWEISDSDAEVDGLLPHETAISASDWQLLARVIVRMDDNEQDSPAGRANARLIAAAPELLAALCMAAAFIESGESSGADFFAVREAWRNAIAKATEG